MECHSAPKLRRDAGESVEDVSRFLDHSSLATTTTYLRRLEGQEDRELGEGGGGRSASEYAGFTARLYNSCRLG